MSWPAQTLHTSYPSSTASFPEGVIRSRSKNWWRLEPCVHGLYTVMTTSPGLLGPSILSSSSLYGSAPPSWNAPQWTHCSHVRHHTWLSFLCCLSLRGRMAKVDKYLKSDHWHLQGAGGRALTTRGGSQELSCQVKSGLHHRSHRTVSDVIGNWIKAIQSQINRRNLQNWHFYSARLTAKVYKVWNDHKMESSWG